MIRRLAAVIFATLLLITPAAAQSLTDHAGTWVWSVEGRPLFVLRLEAGTNGLSGTIERPDRVTFNQSGNSRAVASVQMPVATHVLAYGGETSGGHILRYPAPDGGVRENILRLDERGGAMLQLFADPVIIVQLHRPFDPLTIPENWPDGAGYSAATVIADMEESNAEIAEIFAADQADRQGGPGIDWSQVGPRDEARRARVRQMLDEGLLRTGEDYYYAAFVFQHGGEPDDFLLAHTLAMAAQAKGYPGASWIAAATLDRFLTNTGQPQIFGTQYMGARDGPMTQDPYNRDLLPDSLRQAVGVPTLGEQEARRQQLDAAQDR